MFVGLLADDTHLTVVFHIGLVDITAIVYLRTVDKLVLWSSTVNTNLCFLVTIISRAAVAEQDGGDHIEFRHLTAQALHIGIFHIPRTPFTEALISFGGRLCPHHRGVGGKAGKVLVEQFLESLSTAHQGDEHEHAPEHTEACQEGTRLIACQRIQYLSI